jgi:hypothetical protein
MNKQGTAVGTRNAFEFVPAVAAAFALLAVN